MKKGKKTIRLTESEMVSMIERIVNEVKREKRRQVNESTYVRKRYLMESEEEILTAELEEMDENNPDPTIFNKIESLAKKLGKLPMKINRKLKILKRKHPKMFKNKAGKTTTDCMELNESYSYNKKRLLQEKHQRLILESEGEMILADLESMDENSPNPVLRKLQSHLRKLEGVGRRELNDFKKKLKKFKRQINRAAGKADRNIKNFFTKLFS